MNHLQLACIARDSYENFNYALKGDIEVLVKKDVIGVTGTEGDIQDIIRDIRAYPWYDKKLKSFCHRGFLTAARKVYAVTKDIKHPTLTGHSLGGAVATILAGYFVQDNNYPKELVTFGAPRAGFATLTRVLQPIKQTRYVNGNDAVPSVPWMLGLYQHTSIEQPIGSKDSLLTDHFIKDYIESLR